MYIKLPDMHTETSKFHLEKYIIFDSLKCGTKGWMKANVVQHPCVDNWKCHSSQVMGPSSPVASLRGLDFDVDIKGLMEKQPESIS